MNIGDIDIDVADRTKLMPLLPHTNVLHNGAKHVTGVYFQEIPIELIDLKNNLCKVDDVDMKEAGFKKFDMLNVQLYKSIPNEYQLNRLLEKKTNWDLLMDEDFCKRIYHINNHYDMVRNYKPDSVEDVSDILAMIRPAKNHVYKSFMNHRSKNEVKKEVFTKMEKDGDAYFFKKSHAIAYALLIKLQINFIEEQDFL